MSTAALLALARRTGTLRGITSVCSAHPVVIAAALALGRTQGKAVLIEATCNQVNQQGGYTGMTPADFRAFVAGIAAQEQFDPAGLILGGDHLGPNPWKHLPAAQAMDKARVMIAGYATAGFTKLHLDCSMSCADDPTPLPETEIARRSAHLAAEAERVAPGVAVYVIGTEVPIPGGALEEVAHLAVTTPDAARATVDLHRAAFAAAGVPQVMDRVVGLVVQPGVEFGNENVVPYAPAAARDLVAALDTLPLIYEAHSTDYQTPAALTALVQDGFAILKVGPGLTFALREALYGLDHIAAVLFPDHTPLRDTMEQVMQASPGHWAKYYPGSPAHQYLQRHYSYSDRIRYYWADPVAVAAVATLLARFGSAPIPEPLISQHLSASYHDVMDKRIPATAPALIRAAVTRVLANYAAACR
ncbi:MAG: D-tagatose-bisphosphate aldolase, class II, non-catalytic subunit [Candidatus Saccharibacteria bacterium]|nr:D-tagatose-bisphosphate aldolase, class II, non-catalytic subunit [Pseudorhodobacter sp.]